MWKWLLASDLKELLIIRLEINAVTGVGAAF